MITFLILRRFAIKSYQPLPSKLDRIRMKCLWFKNLVAFWVWNNTQPLYRFHDNNSNHMIHSFYKLKKAIFHRKGIFFSRYSVVICGTSTPTGNLRGCVNLLEIITNNSVQIIFMCNPDITSVCVSMFESVKVDFVKGRQRHSILKFFFSAAVGVIVHHLTERAAYRCTHTLWPRTANGTERLS